MIPHCIPIRREENYHTHYIGKYGTGLQYMGFPFYAEGNQKRPIAVLHLLDEDGAHISSQIWESESIDKAEKAMAEAITKLPNSRPSNISAQIFSVELNGTIFGLIPRVDRPGVEYLPYGLGFFPPWDGTYDT